VTRRLVELVLKRFDMFGAASGPTNVKREINMNNKPYWFHRGTPLFSLLLKQNSTTMDGAPRSKTD